MKIAGRSLLILLLVMFCISVVPKSAYAQNDVSYIGELCIEWNPIPMGPPPDPSIIKLGILYYGNGYYVLNGRGGSAASSAMEPVYGTGVFDSSGSVFVATLTSSSVNGYPPVNYFSVMRLVLNFGSEGSLKSELTFMTVDPTKPGSQSNVGTINVGVSICGI